MGNQQPHSPSNPETCNQSITAQNRSAVNCESVRQPDTDVRQPDTTSSSDKTITAGQGSATVDDSASPPRTTAVVAQLPDAAGRPLFDVREPDKYTPCPLGDDCEICRLRARGVLPPPSRPLPTKPLEKRIRELETALAHATGELALLKPLRDAARAYGAAVAGCDARQRYARGADALEAAIAFAKGGV